MINILIEAHFDGAGDILAKFKLTSYITATQHEAYNSKHH